MITKGCAEFDENIYFFPLAFFSIFLKSFGYKRYFIEGVYFCVNGCERVKNHFNIYFFIAHFLRVSSTWC